MARLKARWRLLVGVLLAAALVGGAVAVAAAQVSTPVRLPPVATDRLIASALRAIADGKPISGHVTAHVDLGLPSLPTESIPQLPSGVAGILSSISGNHRLRVWRSADGLRINELLSTSERSIIVNRSTAWYWDFSSFTAYVVRRPGGARNEPFQLTDPIGLARRALDACNATTAVRVGTGVSVAGRPAYPLIIEPRTSKTLVRRIEIDIDATERLPLRIAVYARGRSAPPLSVTFTQVSFDRIDPATFRFTPPPGAKVRHFRPAMEGHASGAGYASSGAGYVSSGGGGGGAGYGSSGGGTASGSLQVPATAPLKPGALEYHPIRNDEAPKVFGTGWAAIVAIRTPAISELRMQAAGFDFMQFLPFSGPLFSIRLVDRGDHGWLVYGLVPQSALAAVESRLP